MNRIIIAVFTAGMLLSVGVAQAAEPPVPHKNIENHKKAKAEDKNRKARQDRKEKAKANKPRPHITPEREKELRGSRG